MTSILVHGGAARIWPDDDPAQCIAGCERAAQAGHDLLRGGASAIDAVVAATVILEDDPAYNAGIGSALNMEGDVEMDALLMDGAALRAGGVAALRDYRNPIRIARSVMEHSPHILLAGHGAARFAREQGHTPVAAEQIITASARRRWAAEKEAGWPRRPGTVGAIACDQSGNVAVATSTGGISGKLPGRVGDSAMIGCGVYADNGSGAAAATGHGESIMRVVLAKTACDQLRAGDTAQRAADATLAALAKIDGEGGIILVVPSGDLGWAFNSERMSRAYVDSQGRLGSGFGPTPR